MQVACHCNAGNECGINPDTHHDEKSLKCQSAKSLDIVVPDTAQIGRAHV